MYFDKMYRSLFWRGQETYIPRYTLSDAMSVQVMRATLQDVALEGLPANKLKFFGPNFAMGDTKGGFTFAIDQRSGKLKSELSPTFDTAAKIRREFGFLFDYPTIFVRTIISGTAMRRKDIQQLCLSSAQGSQNLLCTVAFCGMKDLVEDVLRGGGVASVKASGGCRALPTVKLTPLAFALIGGNLDVALTLQQYGADIEAPLDMHSPAFRSIPPLSAIATQIEDPRIIAGMIDVLGADVDSRDGSGVTALCRAATKKNKDMIQVLIERGADPNLGSDGFCPLLRLLSPMPGYEFCPAAMDVLCAAKGIDLKAVDEFDRTLLFAAVEILEQGPPEHLLFAARRLLGGSDVAKKCEYGIGAMNVLHWVCANLKSDVMVQLAKDLVKAMPLARIDDEVEINVTGPNEESVVFRITAFELVMLSEALSLGGPLNQPNLLPRERRLEVMRAIRDRKGDYGQEIKDHVVRNWLNEDLTVCQTCTSLGTETVGTYLWIPHLVREFGFDPYRLTKGSDGNGVNLLHHAVMVNDTAILDMLIDVVGMDIETETQWGWTPLHVAASHNKLEAAKALVERGADTRAKTNASAPARWANKTPFQVSQISGATKVARFLKTYNKSQLAAKPSTRRK